MIATALGSDSPPRGARSLNDRPTTRKRHDELLAVMLMAIRQDIGIQPKDVAETFKPALWSSGQPDGSSE